MTIRSFSLYLFFITALFSCDERSPSKTELTPEATIISLPKVTFLADLPASLAPEEITISDVPQPEIIRIPTPTNGNSGARIEREDETIVLQRPELIKLPTLTDEEGNEIIGKEGSPYVLGDGGVSQFITYTSDDGLSLDAINVSFLDSRGHLWFGTNGGGVSRFDGTTFSTFTTIQGLGGNAVRSIIEDQNGNLWFAIVGGGISKYDGNQFTTFSFEEGLSDDYVFSIIEDQKGILWVGTSEGGLGRFDGESFTMLTTADGLPNDFVLSILEDKAGNLWLGTVGGGISRYDGKTFTSFGEEDGLASNRIRSLFEDLEGNLWIGTLGGGVSKFDGTTFSNYTIQDGLGGVIVRQIIQDKAGDLWFATNGGLSQLRDGQFNTFRVDQGLANNNILSIVEDGNGKLWIGTDGGGVSRYDGRGFSSLSSQQGLAGNIILSAEEDTQGNLWFGTVTGGVSKFNGSSFTNFSTAQGIADDLILSILEDSRGYLWFGTGGEGVSRYDGNLLPKGQGSFTNYTTEQGLAGNDVYSIIEDKNGNLWMGTDGGGVSLFDGEKFTNYTTEQGLAGDAILGIAEDQKGRVWFAAIDGGLSMYDGSSFTNFTTDQGLIDNSVQRVKIDSKGHLWIGTQHGLSFISEKNIDRLLDFANQSETDKPFDRPLIQNFSPTDGLPNEVIQQIVELSPEKMAIGTNLGIVLFDSPGETLLSLDSLSGIEIYNSLNGFPVKDLTDGQNGMFLDSKGRLWAGTGSTKNALVKMDYSALLKNSKAPSIYIKGIEINETQISWHTLEKEKQGEGQSEGQVLKTQLAEEALTFGRSLNTTERQTLRDRFDKISFDGIQPFLPVPQNLVLPYKNNQVNINFSTNELAKANLIEYRYYMEGYDQDWSPIIKKSSATFGNIQEGEYTFNVIARYTGPSTALANEWTQPVTYSFSILPPWYRSWWAYLFYGFLFISLIYPIERYQRKQVIKREQEKARERELEQAREIEKAYTELEASHENLKATQSQLIQSEKMASLGELTAGIAHEIQNPLNFVNNFSEVSGELMDEMREEIEKGGQEEVLLLAQEIKDNLLRISSHGRRADSIVKAMLQHSRTGSGQKELTDINALSDECLRLSYHAIRSKDTDFRGEYELDLDPNLPKIIVIPQDIGKVFLNVTNNAFFSINEKGKKEGENFKPLVKIKTRKVNRGVEVLILDNGGGIPKQVKEKIFQPFFTTKPTGKGTGLGLSLSYDIIKAHGGQIKLKTPKKDDFTTIFSIFLPEKS